MKKFIFMILFVLTFLCTSCKAIDVGVEDEKPEVEQPEPEPAEQWYRRSFFYISSSPEEDRDIIYEYFIINFTYINMTTGYYGKTYHYTMTVIPKTNKYKFQEDYEIRIAISGESYTFTNDVRQNGIASHTETPYIQSLSGYVIYCEK